MVYTGFRSTVLQFFCIKIYKVMHWQICFKNTSEESYRNVFKTGFIIIHVYCSIKCREHNVDGKLKTFDCNNQLGL
jgi:hypothetical protein